MKSSGLLGVWTFLTQRRKQGGWPAGVGALSSKGLAGGGGGGVGICMQLLKFWLVLIKVLCTFKFRVLCEFTSPFLWKGCLQVLSTICWQKDLPMLLNLLVLCVLVLDGYLDSHFWASIFWHPKCTWSLHVATLCTKNLGS